MLANDSSAGCSTRINTIGLLLLVLVVAPSSTAIGENWPGWRGPRGDGTSSDLNVPTQWDVSTSHNLRWQQAIPGVGHSSPAIWEDRAFLTTCLTRTHDRVVVCLDSGTGERMWERVVFRAPLETKHDLNSYASGTPATDGQLVFVTFLEVGGATIPAPNVSRPRPVTVGQIVVAAYDFEGNQRWLQRPGSFVSVHGFCSSPVLHRNLVIVNGDHDGESYIVALDKRTGKEVWKTPREHQTRSYATPIIRKIGGRHQLVLSGSMCVAGFDAETGDQLWKIDGPTEQFVASMVFDGELFYLAAGYPTHHVMAVRPDDSGRATVAWHQKNARCYVPSPVVVNGYLLVADDRGTANCFEAASGKRLWNERLGHHYSTSMVTANGLVYLLADDGVTKVIRPGRTLDVIAENALGESCHASPAISQGRLYLRGTDHLFCIGDGAQ